MSRFLARGHCAGSCHKYFFVLVGSTADLLNMSSLVAWRIAGGYRIRNLFFCVNAG